MVFEKVRQIICEEFEADEYAVTPNAELEADLGIEDNDLIDLVMSLEDEFEVELPDEALAEIVTVGDLVNYIEDHAATESDEDE